MRIVQIVENLQVGGLERMAVDLARAQKAAGHEPLLICLFEPGLMAEEARRSGIPVDVFHKTAGFSPAILARLACRLWRIAPDVVHTHNLGVHIYGAPAARLAGVAAVVNTRHGFISSQGQPYRESRFRATMRWTGAVVSVSEHSRRYFVEQGIVPAGKARVILNGVPVEEYASRPAHPMSARPRLRFGAIGRMVPVKGHAILLEAFAEVARHLPDAELRIVGGGPLEDSLRAQAGRLGLGERVSIEPLARDVAGVLSEFDIFVFPSTNEGLPLVILEAMSAGLPIVSTRVGGVPEVAPEGTSAWYCPTDDAPALAEAMLAAATCPDLAAMGEANRQIALRCYTLQTMQRAYESLFHDLLAARRP